MEGKTVKYRISRDEWKLFFARLAPKARYLWYLFALTAVFYALYTLLSMALAGTTAAGAVYLLFVVYILLFIYIARGALSAAVSNGMSAGSRTSMAPQTCTMRSHSVLIGSNTAAASAASRKWKSHTAVWRS